ncbi:hypothetical protein [Methylobacterium aquaticum]|uniref:hypothetical protein n=1 Tax=Methylobacterium aquaticum TaxID=270351 RepID=UPI000A7D5CB0|nr:hypothetical protein [Methylobacterium aquaticum]
MSPADPEHINIIAHHLHKRARQRVTWWPAWEDLDMTDPFEAEVMRLASVSTPLQP